MACQWFLIGLVIRISPWFFSALGTVFTVPDLPAEGKFSLGQASFGW